MNRWNHAPPHALGEPGAYMVTAGTYKKTKLFNSPERLDLLQNLIMKECERVNYEVQQWAIFPNHYHLVFFKKDIEESATLLFKRIHSKSAIEINRLDSAKGRKVWFNFWDSHITNERDFLARSNYVRLNPQRHGLTKNAEDYKWCSARWFKENATTILYEEVTISTHEALHEEDDF